jgi:hypothetical protein
MRYTFVRVRSAPFLAGVLLAASCGGGGSGSTGGSSAGTVGFSALWQQSASKRLDGPAANAFAATIPPSVDTVRITFQSFSDSNPLKCCVAVTRGSEAFAMRRVELASLPAGDAEITIGGYPTDFAPADGFVQTCATVPASAASSCDPVRQQAASFVSDPQPIEIVGGETTDAGTIVVFSSPFVTERTPAPGQSVPAGDVSLQLAVVDAAAAIDPASINVSLRAGSPPSEITLSRSPDRACDDASADPAAFCTAGGEAGVSGFIVEGTAGAVPEGTATVNVTAANTNDPPRLVDTSYSFEVFTTTTTSTTTTTTTSTSTTTTMPGPVPCAVTFSVTDSFTLASLHFEVSYQASDGTFVGSADMVDCSILVGDVSTANHNVTAHTLDIAFVTGTSVTTPVDVAVCTFESDNPMLAPSDFGITLIEATRPDLVAVQPTVAITQLDCSAGAAALREQTDAR